MHEAEAYLRNPQNPSSLYVVIEGKKRRIFINRQCGQIGIIAPGKRTHGFLFAAWNTIEKVLYPGTEKKDAHQAYIDLTKKFKRLAAKASFTNDFIRRCLAADESRSPYDNRLTTGCKIDGDIISFKAIEKWYPLDSFREAIRNRKPYRSGRFDFRGYDGSLAVEPRENGDLCIYFSKEYRDCANGYYYLAINDESFIGTDID